MFNSKMIDVLTQVNGITNSIILKYPHTVGLSESQDMLFMVDVSELDTDEFTDIPLKNSLNELLSLFKLFPETKSVQIEGNSICINSGSLSSSFIMDNIALMDAHNRDSAQFEATEKVPSVATFDLTVDDIKNLKSASGVFKDLSEIIFKSQDGDMLISLGATNKFNAKSNTFSLTKQCMTTKEFEIKIPVENFKMLPMSDYTFDVKFNSAKNSYRLFLTNKSLKCFKLIMVVKV